MKKILLLIVSILLALLTNKQTAKAEPDPRDYTITYEYETRLTSYYPSGRNVNTGCGLQTYDFEVNEFGWYTYQGKLVVATATNYLLNYGWRYKEEVRLYNYYDELILNIDGVDYVAVVLDSCGICMTTGRIDLFVAGRQYIKDTTIIVKEVEKNQMV